MARRRAAQRDAVYTAWHVAALHRQDRLPEIGDLMARLSGEAETEQSPEQQLRVARAIAAAFGADRGPA